MTDSLSKIWFEKYKEIHEKTYDFSTKKPIPSEWVEENIVLPEGTSKIQGRFSYDLTPYMREIIDILHPSDPTRNVVVMKSAQSGATAGVIIPGICYIMSQNPAPILLTSADATIAKKTLEERLDPILHASKLDYLIRPQVVKKGNSSTGNTKDTKQFAGGSLTALGINNPDKFRFYSICTAFADDFDSAPSDVGNEGNPKVLIEGRQTTYEDIAKTFYVSTPTETGSSNIYREYSNGTQEKWHWKCTHCNEQMVTDFQIKLDDGTFAGIVWELDKDKKLIKESVKFKCPHCLGLIDERDKYELNLKGKWISTVDKPEIELTRSFYLNTCIIPSTFVSWSKLVYGWLEANPHGRPPIVDKLKAFMNVKLGLPFEKKGEVPKSTNLMQNTSAYQPNTVPTVVCEKEDNRKIIMLTMACDLNGEMEKGNEDVRLDYEIVAHASTGVTYSIDHGSIGTFKRKRHKSVSEKKVDLQRERWTYREGVRNSVWSKLLDIIDTPIETQEGDYLNIGMTLIDTGHFTKYANNFIRQYGERKLILGVKGFSATSFRKIIKNATPFMQSKEAGPLFYNIDVDYYKDLLAENMKLEKGNDDYQPSGFMNFPLSLGNKYTYKDFFMQFEGEKRIEEFNGDQVIGFKWEKKNSGAINHFWDCRVYNLASIDIFLKLKAKQYKVQSISWERFASEQERKMK